VAAADGSRSLLVVGHLLLTVKRFVVTERGKEKSDADSAESNRMLGLAFQGQGQLDMAFDKFRKCPMDDQVMENLYNLALDFERKRQFNKAEAAFRYIFDFNPKFRDIEVRVNRAKQLLRNRDSWRRRWRTLECQPARCQWQRREANAGSLPDREGAGQGRHGRGVHGARSQDQSCRRHQDHGLVAGVRG
jgi:tetratricopeptide (TPR) repeat protein